MQCTEQLCIKHYFVFLVGRGNLYKVYKSQTCLVSIAMTYLDLLPSLDGLEAVRLWLLTELSYEVTVLVGAW